MTYCICVCLCNSAQLCKQSQDFIPAAHKKKISLLYALFLLLKISAYATSKLDCILSEMLSGVNGVRTSTMKQCLIITLINPEADATVSQ